MNRVIRKAVGLVLATLAILFAGCTRKPLVVEGMLLDVTIDKGAMGEKIPELFLILFYDRKTGVLCSSDYISPEGGTVHLAAGDYYYVLYNYDLESVSVVEQSSYRSILARNADAPSSMQEMFNHMAECYCEMAMSNGGEKETVRKVSGSDSRVVYEPDLLFTATGTITVGHRSSLDAVAQLTVCPENRTKTVNVRLSGLSGVEYVRAATLYLSNLSDGYSPSEGKPGEAAGAISCDLTKDNSGTYVGKFRNFGYSADVESGEGKVIAYIIITDTGGGQFLCMMDATPCFSEDACNLDLEYRFTIPEPVSGGDGFVPALEDWNPEIVPIFIGNE